MTMRPIAPPRFIESRIWPRPRTHLIALLAACLLALSACSDGGGVIGRDDDDDDPPAQCASDDCGQVVIGLTDADGDFLSYAVDVVSIELKKASGDAVQTLFTEQRVDFADLVDVTEFVTAATIANGTYVAATITLDNANHVVIAPGLPALLQLDFDLAATHDVDTVPENAVQAVVTTWPVLCQFDRISRRKLLEFFL